MLRADVQQTCTTRAALFFIVVVLDVMVGTAVSLCATQPDTLPMPMASSRVPAERLSQYSDLAVEWLEEYLRIDTTNPPGNEIKAATFLKKILDEEGIENQIFEYQPGRADLWARLPHTAAQPKRPLILLNHMDVVTSDINHWRVPPFSGQMLDGSIYGRGAQDMKNEGIAQLMVLIMAKREKAALDRDI
jgi:acetylornithine deacetylase/succinyl-diaminopimelate desuccinylase-like protein